MNQDKLSVSFHITAYGLWRQISSGGIASNNIVMCLSILINIITNSSLKWGVGYIWQITFRNNKNCRFKEVKSCIHILWFVLRLHNHHWVRELCNWGGKLSFKPIKALGDVARVSETDKSLLISDRFRDTLLLFLGFCHTYFYEIEYFSCRSWLR